MSTFKKFYLEVSYLVINADNYDVFDTYFFSIDFQ